MRHVRAIAALGRFLGHGAGWVAQQEGLHTCGMVATV